MRRGGPPWGSGPPPWWPQGQTWPPRRRWDPTHFIARALVAFVLFIVFVQVLATAVVWLVGRALGVVGVTADALSVVLIAGVVIVVFMGAMASTFGRTARPLADLAQAVERVADGEYDTRVAVPSHGPRRLRRLVDAFNRMVERLREGESQRRRLLADVTHELRTPLSVIQGRLEGVVDGVYPRDDATLGAILDETRQMSRIIEDLRLLSLAESGGLRLTRAPMDVGEIVDDVLEAYRAGAASGGTELASTIGDVPAVDADATRVREVLENLVSNAIRYTPSGGRVSVSAERDGGGMLAVSVSDTGRGVSAEELPRLFERFHRSPDSPGTGLGLVIARDLVRAHGGEMTAASEGEGRGLTVRFTLPVATS